MALLPLPYPDEVIGSVITRGVWHSGLSRDNLLQSIYGYEKSSSSFLMGTSFAALGLAAGVDEYDLMQLHTVFPYATAFMPAAVRNELVSKALSPVMGHDCLSSLTKNVSHGVPFRRFCRACVKEDLATFGESYWHRQHLLPATLICLRHSEMLAVTDIPLRGNAHGRDRLLPHMAPHRRLRCRIPFYRLQRLAEMSQLALSGYSAGDGILNHYRNLAIDRGYVLENRLIAGQALSRRLRSFYGDEFLTDAGCAMFEHRGWPALMLRPDIDIPFATTKHLLLQVFFEFDGGVTGIGELGNKPPGKVTRDYEQFDKDLMLRLLTIWKRVKALKLRITVEHLLTEAGARTAFKHKRALMPRSEALILEFRASNQSERQIGGRPYWRERLPSRYTKPDQST